MARPLRVEYSGASYHVCYRGNDGQEIFLDDEDRAYFVERLRQTVNRYEWRMFAFVQMTNHGQQFFQTPEPNLSAGMQFLLHNYSALAGPTTFRHS